LALVNRVSLFRGGEGGGGEEGDDDDDDDRKFLNLLLIGFV
jgi:hypothetical protein